MKMKMCKFVSMIVVLVMTFVCAIPAFAAAPSGQVGYAVNRNGETYGNNLEALEIGYEADLIFAEGEDGVQGYVRARDLDDSVESPNEAVNPTADEYIPLYDSDGVAVIGRFKVTNSDVCWNANKNRIHIWNNGLLSAIWVYGIY